MPGHLVKGVGTGQGCSQRLRTQCNTIILWESYEAVVKRLKLKHAQAQAITPPAG